MRSIHASPYRSPYGSALRVAALVLVALPSSAAQEGLAQRVDELARAAVERPECVGLSVAVARGSELVVDEGYGMAELEHGISTNAETMFRIGSITKQFTAAAIVQLAETDELWYEDSLSAFLPDYPAPGGDVTVRHLLTHTSGIPSYTGLRQWAEHMARDVSHAEMLSFFEDLPLEFPPGEGFEYNNSGYYLLGMIVEEVSGTTYADYVRTRLCEPLGLARTRYGSNADIIPNRAQGYRMNGAGELENDQMISMSHPAAAGALLSTAGDLVRWQLALTAGRVVSPESYEEMTTPYLLPDMGETGYGFGLFVGTLDGRRNVYHGGGIPGFNSMLYHFPEEELSVAVISNSDDYSAQGLAQAIAREAFALGGGAD